MKKPTETPCNQCPFRRKAIPGYLGNDTPENFLATTLADHEMPCHMTVDYEDPMWKVQLNDPDSEARFCAGAAIFFANIAKLSRDRRRPRLPKNETLVFASSQEFLDHHRSSSEEFVERATKAKKSSSRKQSFG